MRMQFGSCRLARPKQELDFIAVTNTVGSCTLVKGTKGTVRYEEIHVAGNDGMRTTCAALRDMRAILTPKTQRQFTSFEVRST